MDSVKIITPKAMLSYPHLDVPQASQDGGKAKYSCALVFPPGTDLSALRSAAILAGEEKFGKQIKVGTKPMTIEKAIESGVLRNPLRADAEAKGYPEGSIFVNVRSERQPGTVFGYAGGDGKPAPVPTDKVREVFYPGAIVRASLVAFGYDSNGNKGVSFGLQNVQFLADGERLDGRVKAEDEFDAIIDSADAADLEGLI